MPTINYSVTQSIDTLAVNLSASEALVMNIDNPLIGASYFGLETIPDNNGVYTTSSPKNTSGSFTLGTGVLGVVRDDYKMSAVVSPGSNVLTFVPAQAVTGSTLRTRGIAAPPLSTGYDPDAQAFFDRVTTAGGALTSTEQTAVNQLVLDMKAYGIWSAMKAVYPMVGASAAACSQNLKSSSFTGTFSSGWTFASTGVTGNGTSAYMDTNLTPSVAIASQDSVHISYYSRSNISTAVDFGARVSSPVLTIISGTCNDTGAAYFRINHALGESSASNSGSSLKNYIFNRVNSTSESVFINTSKSTISKTSSAAVSLPIFLSSYNNNGTPSNYSNRQCAMFTIGDGLTDTQASNFYTAVQAFQTTLGRQI